ncbi:MAG: aminopeptidase N [Pseudomonadota bacterium]
MPKDSAPQTIFLKDYTPFGFDVEDVHLTFDLAPSATLVTARIRFAPVKDAADPTFFLHGEDLTLISAKIDGEPVAPVVTDTGLTCDVPNVPFTWEAEVQIDPAANTALEGLYLSNGMYCTQCEAEGFRKITFYPDRPDVMSTFTVRINGPHPVLLSNGNPVAQGDGWAEWHDPWPKPAYLFALVAGELVAHRDSFTTMEGRHVDLALYVRPGDEGKCAFGMQALKDSMKWDEDVYGRAYDLDVFNIVAVDDFNMGAMENKGLNIFNASAVLASPETSTDGNFERIEAIIAHEYFHNWTGNRITCRDWFQLCLKEGLTVFRDAQFTSDMRGAELKRIGDASFMRTAQFTEDQGPLAHPVRPDSYQEINNFYTLTVYEKGAEVIGMLKRLVGDDAYKRALDLYFDRHDGQACTIEDWLTVFEDTTGRDLTQFKRWYTQAGTPHLKAEEVFEDGTYTLTFTQETAPSTPSPNPQPQLLPIAVGLLNPDGSEAVPTQVLEMTEATQSFSFAGLDAKPVASILREFSAPVVLDFKTDHAFLLAHDTDPFNRWDAARVLSRESLIRSVTEGTPPDAAYIDTVSRIMLDDSLNPVFRSTVNTIVGQSELAAELHRRDLPVDPDAIWAASQEHYDAMAHRLAPDLEGLLAAHQVHEAYAPTPGQVEKRHFSAHVLGLMARLGNLDAAQEQFDTATNMTQSLGALGLLVYYGRGDGPLAQFETRWKNDRLVMDKWFGLQVSQTRPDDTVDTAKALTQHPDFNWKNPNRFRATIGAVVGHHAGFHAKDGSGYTLLADWLIKLDPVNPQTTARMCAAFQTWLRYDAIRQNLIGKELDRIAGTPNLSRDTTEMISRIREA